MGYKITMLCLDSKDRIMATPEAKARWHYAASQVHLAGHWHSEASTPDLPI